MKRKLFSAITSVIMAVGCFGGMSGTATAEDNSTSILEKGVVHNFTLGYNETVEFSYIIQDLGKTFINVNSDEEYFYDLEVKTNEKSLGTVESKTGYWLYNLTADEDDIGTEVFFSFSNSDYNLSEEDKHEISICIMNHETDEGGYFLGFDFELPARTILDVPFDVYANSRISIGFEDYDEHMYCELINADGSEDYGDSVYKGEINLKPGKYYMRIARSDNNCSEEPKVMLGLINRTSATQLGGLVGAGDILELELYDAIAVAQYIMGMIEFDDKQMLMADYDFNDVVDLYDVIAIARDLMS